MKRRKICETLKTVERLPLPAQEKLLGTAADGSSSDRPPRRLQTPLRSSSCWRC